MIRLCKHIYHTNFTLLSPRAKVLWLFAAAHSDSDGLVQIHIGVLPRLAGLSEAEGVEALEELSKHNFYDNDEGPFLSKHEEGNWHVTKILRWKCPHCEALFRAAIPMSVRAEILLRGECAHCGATENLEVDHIRPVSLGGSNDRDNLQALCRTCNRKKLNRFIG